jgi:DNA-binding MarR family transcriptional regulator
VEKMAQTSDKSLTENEQKVIYGLIRFPDRNDKELAEILKMKDSTLTSIKKRLHKLQYFQSYYVPMLNRLGIEMLGIIATDFNPIIPLEERINLSTNDIESNEEIFLSIGALEQGFSLSFVQDYSTFAEINEARTEIFGKEKLIDKSYPFELVFPFDISKIYNFFDYSHCIQNFFNIDLKEFNLEAFQRYLDPKSKKTLGEIPIWSDIQWFKQKELENLKEGEKKVLLSLIENPNATMSEIGNHVELSRHTVSRMKKKFFDNNLIKEVVIPDLQKIGFNVLVLYFFNLSPKQAFKEELLEIMNVKSTIFFSARKFSMLVISAYKDYAEYKEDKLKKFGFLEEKNYVNLSPSPRKFVYNQLKIFKDFNLAPITRKILKINLPPLVLQQDKSSHVEEIDTNQIDNE